MYTHMSLFTRMYNVLGQRFNTIVRYLIGNVAGAWAACPCLFVKSEGFITRCQGTVLSCTGSCCVCSCWGGSGVEEEGEQVWGVFLMRKSHSFT